MTREKLIEAQIKYCEEKDYPFFAPKDGYCWHCRENIVTDKWTTEHITSCPRCSRSYCD